MFSSVGNKFIIVPRCKHFYNNLNNALMKSPPLKCVWRHVAAKRRRRGRRCQRCRQQRFVLTSIVPTFIPGADLGIDKSRQIWTGRETATATADKHAWKCDNYDSRSIPAWPDEASKVELNH